MASGLIISSASSSTLELALGLVLRLRLLGLLLQPTRVEGVGHQDQVSPIAKPAPGLNDG